MTSPHMIFKTNALNTSKIKSICPSCNGNRILVGSKGGIVRMWDINLVRNQAVTMDTQDNDDADMQKFIPAVSHSGKIVATESMQSVEFWNTTT